jgi:hypothetical protein
MTYFTTAAKAHEWARTYGYTYTYRVVPHDGMFYVQWDYREPAGC